MPVGRVGGKGNLPQQLERKGEAVQRNHREREPIYEEILTYVHQVLVSGKPWFTEVARQEAARRLNDFTQRVTACGSERVVRVFLDLMEVTRACAASPSLVKLADQFGALEDLLLAIRADLGYENGAPQRTDWLPLFVSDLDRYLCQSGVGQ